jgi:hypothetical protein
VIEVDTIAVGSDDATGEMVAMAEVARRSVTDRAIRTPWNRRVVATTMTTTMMISMRVTTRAEQADVVLEAEGDDASLPQQA